MCTPPITKRRRGWKICAAAAASLALLLQAVETRAVLALTTPPPSSSPPRAVVRPSSFLAAVRRPAAAAASDDDNGGALDGRSNDAPSSRSVVETIRARRMERLREIQRGVTEEDDGEDEDDAPVGLIDAEPGDASIRTGMGEEGKEEEAEEEPVRTTLVGGPSQIFAMARRMLVWDDETYRGQNDTYRDGSRGADPSSSSAGASTSAPTRPTVLPRWHPTRGISDVNPSFRSRSPAMNNAGYAAIIRRNSRKRNKPSLWRYALRVYDRMRTEEQRQRDRDGGENGARSRLVIQRSAVHHEGALVAASKLGLWQEALRIYREAEEEENKERSATATVTAGASAPSTAARNSGVTDNMVLSLVSACVRGSKRKESTSVADGGGGTSMHSIPAEERRVSLDAARDVLLNLEEKHGMPLNANHVNPLAAAYQALGFRAEASDLIQRTLSDRIKPSNGDEAAFGDDDTLNINNIRAKDRASYSLLVKGAVSDADWSSAVQSLKAMTETGLYPNERNLNTWSEVSERRQNGRGNRRSWKKKRDEHWMGGV